jgi:hypothetical protein
MKQIEIDCVKDFAEKMREFGYVLHVEVKEEPTTDYKPFKHITELKLRCWRQTDICDTPLWQDFNLAFRLSNPQKCGTEE